MKDYEKDCPGMDLSISGATSGGGSGQSSGHGSGLQGVNGHDGAGGGVGQAGLGRGDFGQRVETVGGSSSLLSGSGGNFANISNQVRGVILAKTLLSHLSQLDPE